MEGSIEMKMQAIDKMIELRNQLIVMQKNIGVWNGFDKDDVILIYDNSDFFNIARHVGANVNSDNVSEIGLRTVFNYKDVKFVAYIKQEEYQMYEHEIYKGDENVL